MAGSCVCGVALLCAFDLRDLGLRADSFDGLMAQFESSSWKSTPPPGASMYGPREKFVLQQGEWINVPSGKGYVEQDGVFIQGDLESDEDE
jgi:hypothetical protein